ncbi:LysM peptidoglycan-binding domain-containing protein [Nocardia abscessus]|uniref:LysM peptidoglycan-binding domain-containing protein n=1 Tax=Nocardia abscessus TaxID=120957 RepID=UPI00189565DB|nr:LysM domain-containing protein [Nocardia abscessus]MBF6338736.1 LysM peptidoglycan-binding domain-containing protein [Nocardia abscessus]
MAAERHTVVAGETLSGIVKKKYGDLRFLQAIADLNDIANPNLIRVGQEIMLPVRSNLA